MHFYGAVIFGVAAVVSAVLTGKHADASTNEATNYLWSFTVLLLGKFISYAASAWLHLYPFSSTFWVTEALKADLLGVACSVGFTCLAFFPVWSPESLQHFQLTSAFLAANYACIQWTFSGHVGLRTPQNRSEVPRNVFVGLQFADIVVKMGTATEFSPLFLLTMTAYVTSFILAGPVTNSHEDEPIVALFFWHKKQRNSLHEDFHAVLAVADLLVVKLAWEFIQVKVGGG